MEKEEVEKRARRIFEKVIVILADYERLIDRGCSDSCEGCPLNEAIIPESTGGFYRMLTICDILGILQDEL